MNYHQPLTLKMQNQHHLVVQACDINLTLSNVQAQLAGAVPVPGAPPLPLILANQIQGSDIMRQVRFFIMTNIRKYNTKYKASNIKTELRFDTIPGQL